MSLRVPFASRISPARAAIQLPEKLDSPGLLVGWSMEHEHKKRPFGFTFGDSDSTPQTGFVDPVLMNSEGHLITIAPTGAGKGVGCIIPALLRHKGPAIVIDPKGENTMVTARRRRELGQEVVVIDPAGITGLGTGALNPLDIIRPGEVTGVDMARAMTHALLPEAYSEQSNRYWSSRARQLLLGVILHVVTDRPKEEHSFAEVRAVVAQIAADPEPWAAKFAASRHPEVRLSASILKMAAKETLSGIVSFAQEGVDFLGGPQIDEVTSHTSFPLDAVTRGDPVTIFIVLPPHLLESYGRLLRLWISALFSLITRRRARPQHPTLFVLDEAAQLGELDELRQALTLLRGYGLQTWSFWQDVSQLTLLYPSDWKTMLNNCSVIQTFGPNNLNAARDMASVTGFFSPEDFLALDRSEMLLQIAGDEVVVAKLPNYREDPIFAGQFDSNPMFNATIDPVPEPRPLREYLRPEPERGRQRPELRLFEPKREAGELPGRAPGAITDKDTALAAKLEAWLASGSAEQGGA